MNKYFCDKCGKEIRTYPSTNIKLPSYEIKVRYDAYSMPISIDLCRECEENFKKWLNTK